MFHDEEKDENVRNEDEETPSESSDRSEPDKETSDMEEEGSAMEDNEIYRNWYKEAIRATQEPRIQKFRKNVEDENVNDARAREKAYAKTLWAIKGHFSTLWRRFSSRMYDLATTTLSRKLWRISTRKRKKGWI